jgi:hypothetical protein
VPFFCEIWILFGLGVLKFSVFVGLKIFLKKNPEESVDDDGWG